MGRRLVDLFMAVMTEATVRKSIESMKERICRLLRDLSDLEYEHVSRLTGKVLWELHVARFNLLFILESLGTPTLEPDKFEETRIVARIDEIEDAIWELERKFL